MTVPSKPRTAALRVLVVEDEARMRDMLVRAVGEMGFESVAVQSAEQAIKLLGREPGTDVVLLDLNLPGMDGLELLKHIRTRHPVPEVIVLTGFGSLDAAKIAIRHDVVDFLTKPCRLDELETSLARAQERRAKLWQAPAPDVPEDARSASPGEETLEEVEQHHILAVLERHAGNRARAAAELGISERTLYYRLARYQRWTR